MPNPNEDTVPETTYPVEYVAEPAEPLPPAAQLEELDRYRGELAHTKLRLAMSDVQKAEYGILLAQAAHERALIQEQRAREEMQKVQTAIGSKYGINWATHRIDEATGRIITLEEANQDRPSR